VKKITIITLLFSLLFSCSKTEDILKCDCTNYIGYFEPDVCEGTLCQSDTCQTYLGVWKALLRERNNMSQDFFNRHISVCRTSLDRWNDGISFRIKYKISIEWMETELWDQFIIWLSPSTAGVYPSLSLPRNSLLTKDQVSGALSKMAFSSSLNTISPIHTLIYHSLSDAKRAMNIASKTDTLCMYEYYYERPHMVVPPDGDPFLKGHGVLNWDENRCITSTMNLRTGEVNVEYGVCYIIN
jgi:hypothetical protein